MFIYEAVLSRDEDGIYLKFPDFPGVVADGDDLEETVDAAAETLRLVLADFLDTGRKLPEPTLCFESQPGRVAVCVDVTDDFIERTKCITQKEAAEELGLTKGRVSRMLDDGVLQAVPYGNDRLVTLASVEQRKRMPKKAGRPRKSVVIEFDEPVKMGWIGRTVSNYGIYKQEPWKGNVIIGFQSGRLVSGALYSPSLFDGLEKTPMSYEGECFSGGESKECIFSVRDDGMFFLHVIKGKDDYELFEDGNTVDSLTIFVRSVHEHIEHEDFIR